MLSVLTHRIQFLPRNLSDFPVILSVLEIITFIYKSVRIYAADFVNIIL